MKIITLVPVKNEGWILADSLKNYSSFSDHIIVADQDSTDDTLSICEKFEKVTIIKNPYKAHTNQIRWLLLDEARKIEGNNIIIYLDADELLSPDCVTEMRALAKNTSSSISFKSLWIQLLHSYKTYRVDGVWKNNYKEFAFLDDRKIDYDRTQVTADHSKRIPDTEEIKTLDLPILHLQYLAKKRCEIKQAFYMCTERIAGINPKRINHRYSVARFSEKTKTELTPSLWYRGIDLPNESVFTSDDEIKTSQVLTLMEEKGVLFFEPLDIWHIDILLKKFTEVAKRTPKVSRYSPITVSLNTIKNKLKNGILTKIKG